MDARWTLRSVALDILRLMTELLRFTARNEEVEKYFGIENTWWWEEHASKPYKKVLKVEDKNNKITELAAYYPTTETGDIEIYDFGGCIEYIHAIFDELPELIEEGVIYRLESLYRALDRAIHWEDWKGSD